jgi:hypothetical protein
MGACSEKGHQGGGLPLRNFGAQTSNPPCRSSIPSLRATMWLRRSHFLHCQHFLLRRDSSYDDTGSNSSITHQACYTSRPRRQNRTAIFPETTLNHKQQSILTPRLSLFWSLSRLILAIPRTLKSEGLVCTLSPCIYTPCLARPSKGMAQPAPCD